MTFSAHIQALIRASGAYSNPFFDRCKAATTIDVTRLQPYARNWYFVTKDFALAAIRYPSYLAELLRHEMDPEETQRLQEVLQEATLIAANDLGLALEKHGNPPGRAGIHYMLFGAMTEKIGLGVPALEKVGWTALEVETRALILALREDFAGYLGGAACLRVVEEIAFNIVDSMLPLFRGVVDHNGERIFADLKELLYLTLHREIEQHHAEQSQGIVELLATTPDRQQVFETMVRDLTHRFSSFWERMDTLTFGG